MPGMVLATVFVVAAAGGPRGRAGARGDRHEQEQAARSLGANAVQTFRRITLPAIKWAVVYGVVLSLARSLGEFGAVKVVSGNVVGADPDRHAARRADATRTSTQHDRLRRSRFLLVAGRGRSASSSSRSCARRSEQLMSIEVRDVNKRFGDFVALDDVVASTSRPGS